MFGPTAAKEGHILCRIEHVDLLFVEQSNVHIYRNRPGKKRSHRERERQMSTEESPSAFEGDQLALEDREEHNAVVSLGEMIPWPLVAWFLDRD